MSREIEISFCTFDLYVKMKTNLINYCFLHFFYSSLYCWQFLNGLFVLRMALKGLVELCEDENQFLQCLEGTGRFEKLLKAVIQTINMIDEAAIGISYHLQLESVQLIIMVSIEEFYLEITVFSAIESPIEQQEIKDLIDKKKAFLEANKCVDGK